MLLDTFIAFSYTPIRVVTLTGLLSAGFTAIYSGYIVTMYFLTGAKVTGWSSLAMLITMFGGLTLLSLGVIGEYLWRILDQVRKRPLYVVDEVHL